MKIKTIYPTIVLDRPCGSYVCMLQAGTEWDVIVQVRKHWLRISEGFIWDDMVQSVVEKKSARHCVNIVHDLLYKGCEDHWKCEYCGDAWPIHCWTKHDLETQECPGVSIEEALKSPMASYPCYTCRHKPPEDLSCPQRNQCGLLNYWYKNNSVIPEGTPQTPDQADDTSVQPTAVTAEDILRAIRTHNAIANTFERMNRSPEVKIPDSYLREMQCRIEEEVYVILHLAKQLGINVTLNTQRNVIILK